MWGEEGGEKKKKRVRTQLEVDFFAREIAVLMVQQKAVELLIEVD